MHCIQLLILFTTSPRKRPSCAILGHYKEIYRHAMLNAYLFATMEANSAAVAEEKDVNAYLDPIERI